MEQEPTNPPGESRKGGLLAQVFVAALVLAGLYLSRENYNYLLFHTIAEVFAIVIACGTFMVAWNARRFLNNGYLMLVGISSLFVGAIDLAHTMAYDGMPIFRTTGPNMATELWIAARYLGSMSLLIAPLFLTKRLRAVIALCIYAGITLLLLGSIIVWKVFPDCYVQGFGLTTFKVASEYVICGILIAAGYALWSHRAHFDRQVLAWLIASMALTVLSELAFTFYTRVDGPANLLGHYFKIIAFYFLYKAMIETGFAKPFALLLRENALREQRLQAAKEELDKANAELERRVAERTASLQEATDDLNTFVYSVAHDLRAPSRAQHGFGSMLLETHRTRLTPHGIDCVEKIVKAALKMDALVTGLLSYVTVSREKPVLQPVDLAECVRQAVEESEARIRNTAAKVNFDDVQGTVSGSAVSVQRAVFHLLDNALKFANPGETPEVRLRTEPRGEWLRLWVEDNGIGIAPQYHEKIFGVFQRLHREGQYEGMGIGLALAKKSIERLGGRLGLESTPGAGSRFWIELVKSGE